MSDSLSFSVIALISLALTVLVVLVDYFLITPLRRRYMRTVSYGARLSELLSRLNETSKEVDNILQEISQVARERQSVVSRLGDEIRRLEANENEYRERIETLKNVPVPAIDHLLKELRPSEVRSARRDYVLFIAGVLASTVVNIVVGLAFRN